MKVANNFDELVSFLIENPSQPIKIGFNNCKNLCDRLMIQNIVLDSIRFDRWDVSNVKNMYAMFWKHSNFNQDISGWDVSNVEEMSCMFYFCFNFNQDIS